MYKVETTINVYKYNKTFVDFKAGVKWQAKKDKTTLTTSIKNTTRLFV